LRPPLSGGWSCNRTTHFHGPVNIHLVDGRRSGAALTGCDQAAGGESIYGKHDVGSAHLAISCDFAAAGFDSFLGTLLAPEEFKEDAEFGLLQGWRDVGKGLNGRLNSFQ